jgi:hypothetical protein
MQPACDPQCYQWGAEAPFCGEVKARAIGAGFAVLERWLGENDFLALRHNFAERVILVPWHIWTRLLLRRRA